MVTDSDAEKPPSTASTSTTTPPPVPPSQSAPSTTPEPPPNGGFGWVVTACTFTINAHTWGINSSYGVFLNEYLTHDIFPSATRLDYAFVGGLSIGLSLLIAPLATLTTRRFGTRTTLLLGTLLEFTSLLAASFAATTWQLFLSQGVCFGVGIGFLFVGSVGIIPQWFTTRRSLANGISAAGSGFGGLVYSLAAQAMIRSIGLAWAFRVLALVAVVVNGVCSLVVRDRNAVVGASQLAFDVALLRRVEYWLLLAFGFFSMLGYVVLLFSLVNYGVSVGLTPQQASTVSALLNLGQGLGRPLVGYFSDSIGRINMALLMTLACGILSLVLWIFATSYGLLIFFALVGGAVAGTFWAVVGPVTTEVVGLKHVPSALSIIWVVLSLPTTFSEPIGLELVAFNGGSYTGAQVFVGCTYLGGALAMLLLRGWKIGEITAYAEWQRDKTTDVDAVKLENASDDIMDACRKHGRKRILSDMLKIKKV